jgi:hypothetical protein
MNGRYTYSRRDESALEAGKQFSKLYSRLVMQILPVGTCE